MTLEVVIADRYLGMIPLGMVVNALEINASGAKA
jgi:hypothetical protein